MQDPNSNVDKDAPTVKAEEEAAPVTALPVVGPPKRSHVKLNRAQRAEVRLAFMTIKEAEARFNAANAAADAARTSLMNARSQAQEVQTAILRELDLSAENIIDVENLVVLPPKDVTFVKGKDD